jgi:hypothetical protein
MIREAIGHKCDLAHTCLRRNGRDGRGGEAEEDEGDNQAILKRAPIEPNLEASPWAASSCRPKRRRIGHACGRAATRLCVDARGGNSPELTARKP